MIHIEEFLLLLKNIPVVLQYFLPGYWGIILFAFFNSKKVDNKTALILSCLLSYISLALISLVYQIDNPLIQSGVSFIAITISAILISLLYSAKWFKTILVKHFHKTPNNDIWRDILNLEDGSNLKVYFKDSDIGLVGHHFVHEENGDNSWFAVSAPVKFNITTDEIIDATKQDDKNFIVTFSLSDLEHIEFF